MIPLIADSRSRRASCTRVLLAATLMLSAAARVGRAQDRAIDFPERPILVFDSGGHSARVRTLAFTPDESKLLTGGDDKVVRVWDLTASRRKLAWTIRPPIWRGSAGAVRALALGPPDAQGQQTLAVAGVGVESQRGEIRLFHFPGPPDRRQGDPDGLLARTAAAAPGQEPVGHDNPVNRLVFDPTGTLLASCSNDATVRLWDVRQKVQVARLVEPDQRAVNDVAFTPDGRRLVTGGTDGILRVWDVTVRPPVVVARAQPLVIRANNPAGLAINALGVSPDGRWAVIGREDGALLRYDLTAAELDGSRVRLPAVAGRRQGPVEALAFGPDSRLAVSIIHQELVNDSDRPAEDCDVELRTMPDGAIAEQVRAVDNRVLSLAFSPKGRYLAFAGGDRQAVYVKDLRAPNQAAPAELSGQGFSLWDIGFVEPGPGEDGGMAVAFSYQRPEVVNRAPYCGFTLKGRVRSFLPAARVRRAITALDGWTVRPVGPYRLDVLNNGQLAFPIELTPEMDRRWWSYTFIRPGPKHGKPAIAVATDNYVVIYRLDGGQRTHVLDGHSGSVYCVAPSPDGKWLATGSVDQTVRLWPLAGCDTLAGLGATFEQRDGRMVVASVEKNGFADVSGLKVGDVPEVLVIDAQPLDPAMFLQRLAETPPNVSVEMKVRREGVADLVPFGTTRRDRPALSLFVGLDREWVFWMPRGFYDSSVTGDSNLLGWQINHVSPGKAVPTEFFNILAHEGTLRKPPGVPDNVLDRLVDTADVTVALGAEPAAQPSDVLTDLPPRVVPVLGAGGAALVGPDGQPIAPGALIPESFRMEPGQLAIDWKIETAQKQPPGLCEVRVDGQTAVPPQRPPFDAQAGLATLALRLPLEPGTYRITAVARNNRGIEQVHEVAVEVVGKPKPRPARLTVVTIAPSFTDPNLPAIELAPQDVRDLPPFLNRYLVNATGGAYVLSTPPGPRLAGSEAGAARVLAVLGELGSAPVQNGDLIVVVLEAHVVRRGLETRIAVAGSQGMPPADALSADAVGHALGSLVRRGCPVLLVLDGVHEGVARNGWVADATQWVRALHRDDVATLAASLRKPSQKFGPGRHRVLAQAVLDVIANARTQPGPNGSTVITVADFRTAVLESVERMTQRNGDAAFYVPTHLDAGSPLLNPLAPATDTASPPKGQ